MQGPKTSWRWLVAGCVVLALTGVTHMIAHFAGQPPPGAGDGETLHRLMREFKDPAHGRTTQQVMDGFSLFFSFGLWALAALVLVLRAGLRAHGGDVLRRTALCMACACGLFTVTSVVFWFWPPTVLLGLGTALFACSVWRDGRSAPAA